MSQSTFPEGTALASSLDEVLDAAGVGIWEYDHLTGHTQWNRYLWDSLAYAPARDGDIPSRWLELLHPADRPLVEGRIQAARTAGNPLDETEFRLRAADGRWVWFLSRGRAMERDASGLPLRTAGIMIDVSGRKRADRLLRIQSEFAALLARGPDRQALLEAILEAALELPELDGGGLYWREPDGSYRVVVHRGLSATFIERVAHLGAASWEVAIVREGRLR